MDRAKTLEQNKTALEMAAEREAFGTLGVMCRPTVWSSKWDVGRVLYDFIRDSVEHRENFPGHMAVFERVVDSQKALRRECPVEEQWTLWEICLALENRGANDMDLWKRGMDEVHDAVGIWKDDLYELEISPLFLYLQSEYDDDSDKEDESMMEHEKMNQGDAEQCAIWNRMFIKHVLTGQGEKADEKAILEWTLRYDIKKALHALKTIANM